jgi:hypothetical protein
MPVTNKKSKEEIKKEIDEVLEETPPSIDEPIVVEPGKEEEPIVPPVEEVPSEPAPEVPPEPVVEPIPETITPPVAPPPPVPEPVVPVEVPEVTPPTDEELKSYVLQDGVDIDELTSFEKATARRNYMIEKRQEIITNNFKVQNKASEWSKKVNTFIDSTNNDPKYVGLDGHEAEFRAFALQHPDSDIETLLLPAFLHNLPAVAPKRGSLFEKGGGGQAPEKPKEGIDDADLVKKLRESDPREYARQLKAHKIKIEVD